MKNKKIELVGVFAPVRKETGIEYVIILQDDVLPLVDGQTVSIIVEAAATHLEPA